MKQCLVSLHFIVFKIKNTANTITDDIGDPNQHVSIAILEWSSSLHCFTFFICSSKKEFPWFGIDIHLFLLLSLTLIWQEISYWYTRTHTPMFEVLYIKTLVNFQRHKYCINLLIAQSVSKYCIWCKLLSLTHISQVLFNQSLTYTHRPSSGLPALHLGPLSWLKCSLPHRKWMRALGWLCSQRHQSDKWHRFCASDGWYAHLWQH